MKAWAGLLMLCTWPLLAAAGEVGGITTLYALDPVACSFSFGEGSYGQVVQDGVVKNRQSDIDFGRYGTDQFSAGIEGGRLGAIVDLGTAVDLQRRYSYPETVGNPQGFSSLRISGGKLVVGTDYKTGIVQPLKEADLLATTKGLAQVPVLPGHIYVVRIVDRHDPTFERMAKVLVLQHQPGSSVTFRWELLK
jgi:hypothetical protein